MECYINSRPSYLSFAISVSCRRISPSSVNAHMYVAVLPSSSSVRKATMTLSSVPGINLKLEYPRVGRLFCN